MTAHTALDLVEEVPQLHEDNQACHRQPDVTKELMRDIWGKSIKDQES